MKAPDRRTFPVDAGGCPKCGHMMLLLSSGSYWCPDEDCHFGGYSTARDLDLSVDSKQRPTVTS